MQPFDRRTRKLLSMHGVHHPAADVDRLPGPCIKGGRGLQQIESTHQSCIVKLHCTFVADVIISCKSYQSVMIRGPLIRSDAWLVSLLHICRGVLLGKTSHTACIEVGQSCVIVSSSKRARRMRTHLQQFKLFGLSFWHNILHRNVSPTWRFCRPGDSRL